MAEWFNDNKYFIILFLIVNLVVFSMYGIDKWKAIHHKIRKPKFYISVPLIMILEVASVIYIGYKI